VWCVQCLPGACTSSCGFFGAAWYGTNTQENILQNTLLGGYIGQCVINFLMASECRAAINNSPPCLKLKQKNEDLIVFLFRKRDMFLLAN